MLTIPQRLSLKQMAVYGSTAMIVGFTGILLMLREFAPKDFPTGVAVIKTINKKPATSNSAALAVKASKDASGEVANTIPDQAKLVARGGNLPMQPSSRVSTAAPTYRAPVASTAPTESVASTPATTTGGSVTQPASDASTPASTSGDVLATPNLQETITNTNVIDINKVILP